MLQVNLPDSGAVARIESDKPLSVADVDDLLDAIALLRRQFAKHEKQKANPPVEIGGEG